VPSRQLERLAIHDWRLPGERITYIPNGIEVDRFAQAAASPRSANGRNPLVVGTVSPLRPEKNVGRLMAAFAAARQAVDITLVIAGDGVERARLEQAARDLGIAQFVAVLGNERPEIALRKMDVFALSSDTEQMPNSVLEAMAAGLPIVSVDVGDVASMVASENRPFIVPRDDTAGLAAALVRLAQDPDARCAVGRANAVRARTAYTHQAMVTSWRQLWREVIACHVHMPSRVCLGDQRG